MKITATLTAIVLLGAAAESALAQNFPNKPLRLVTQFRAGSSGSNTFRVVAEEWGKVLGQPMVVDDKPGAGGMLASVHVANSEPDGYTILGATAGPFTTYKFLSKKVEMDPNAVLTPVTKCGESTVMLGASAGAPFSSLKQLLEYAKSNPGKVTYGTSGVGSPHHLSGEQIQQITGVQLRHVPYKASAAALLDTVSGQLMSTFSIYSVTVPHIKSGKIRPIAAIRAERATQMPDVPTITEVIPAFELPPSWTGFFLPVKTPKEIVQRLNAAANQAMNVKEAREKLLKGGFELQPGTPEQLAALIKRQTALVAKIVKSAGIKPR